MKHLISSFLVLATLSSNAMSAERSCQVGFKFDSARVNKKALDACLKSLQLTAADQVLVTSAATPTGPSKYNQALSERRAKSLQAALTKEVPNLHVDTKALGEIARDGLVSIVAVTSPAAVAVAPAPVTTETSGVVATASAPAATEGQWRVALRAGFDDTWVEDGEEYFAPGLDVAYIAKTSDPRLRVEVAALASTLEENTRTRLTTYHLAPMVGYKSSAGYIAGIRALAGVVHSNESRSDYGDAGAELRLGHEMGPWALMFGAGRSRALTRVGLDLGYRF